MYFFNNKADIHELSMTNAGIITYSFFNLLYIRMQHCWICFQDDINKTGKKIISTHCSSSRSGKVNDFYQNIKVK